LGVDVDRVTGPYNYLGFAFTGLLWHTSTGGPTGNSLNEIMMVDSAAGLGVGLASMIMDPLTGRIRECDLIWNANPAQVAATYRQIPNAGPPCAGAPGGGPPISTAIEHEIGHFFGFDHTNVHPGIGGIQPTPNYQPPVLNGAPLSGALFTNFFELPGMVSAFTNPPVGMTTTPQGFWRTHPGRAFHSDEAGGLGELYPVLSPGSPLPDFSQPVPLINTFGRIEGLVVSDELPSSVFGLNVLPLRVGVGGAPEVGKLVGMDRAAGGGGVVGKSDTATGLPCSGNFKIERVTPAFDYSILVEPVESLGFSVTPALAPPAWAEWIYDFNWNPTNNLPWGVLVEGLVSVQLLSSVPHASSLGTLYIAPGTVIENLSITLPGTISPPATETVTRPVVTLDQRSGRPSPFAPSLITATVQHDYELDFNSAVWQVLGGATTVAGVPTTTTQPTNPIGATGPWTTTWTTSLPSLIPAAGTTVLSFRVREFGYDGTGSSNRPPLGISPVFGVNEVRY
jgi:hypothetical protein